MCSNRKYIEYLCFKVELYKLRKCFISITVPEIFPNKKNLCCFLVTYVLWSSSMDSGLKCSK